MENPLVSVIISTYNEEKYILESLESILSQSYTNLEIIIVDDASTDNTVNLIREKKSSKIQLYVNESNKKLAHNLNFAMGIAKGKYIARMDADDIAGQDRISEQVEYMEKHPDIDVLASFAKTFGDSSILKSAPCEHEDIFAEMLFTNPICHPTVMFRTSTMDYLYDETCAAGQDYELWARIISQKKLHVLDKVLLNYRVINRQRKAEYLQLQKQSALKARTHLFYLLYDREEQDEWNQFLRIIDIDAYDFKPKSNQEMEGLLQYASSMIERNKEKKVFEENAFWKALARILFYQWYASLLVTDITGEVFLHSQFSRIIKEQPLLMQAKVFYKVFKRKMSK